MGYWAICGIARAYRFLENYPKAIHYYKKAEAFCPKRNEHLVGLAECYRENQEWEQMLEYTTQMMSPERVCPFPELVFLINTSFYQDTGGYPEFLHNIALENLNN